MASARGDRVYKALYRKWRPKRFDDMVGQEHIAQTLKNAVAGGRLSHSYLFCGPKGTGKTSCSKILARAVNCPHNADGNPCCECDMCKGIESESILDVTEIDAASNSGVDNIRELRSEAGFMPVSAKYRVYIIDEAHMLSTGAFNALLKIMEEPPGHVIFMLATTEIHKVPATILSRCQRFDFCRIDSAVISGRLIHVADHEGISLDEDASLLIAMLSDGGLRDALSLLDLCASSGETITAGTVKACAGLADRRYLFDIAAAVLDCDGVKAIEIFSQLWSQSIDCTRLCEQLIGFYRDVMILKSAGEKSASRLINCLPSEIFPLKNISLRMDMPKVMHSLTVLQDTLSRIGKSQHKRIEFEMGLIRLSAASTEVFAPKQHIPADIPRSAVQPTQKVSDSAPTIQEISKLVVTPLDSWSEILGVLKSKNPALHGALIKDSSAYVGDGILLVDSGGDMFAKMVRESSYAKESLREAVLAVTGKTYRLGPYNSDKHQPAEAGEDKLNDIIKKASQGGAQVIIKE